MQKNDFFSSSDEDDLIGYPSGWAFYVSGGVSGGSSLPARTDDLTGWVLGFGAALADYGESEHWHSLRECLLHYGVTDTTLLADLLFSAQQHIKTSREWFRWPERLPLY